jgi:two-component system chemotaxis response regulator CheB
LNKIRVVVVDDSAYNRRAISSMLESMPGVEVVGYAADGEEGVRKIIDLKPDLVTLDLEMPRMDGFTMLRIVMSRCPTPIIVISSRSDDERVFKALELGAIDFIAKPTHGISSQIMRLQQGIHQKISAVFNLNMANIKRREAMIPEQETVVGKPQPLVRRIKPAISVVAIGSSTGGPPALQGIFCSFREKYPFAVVVSQHMPPGFTRAFAERLNRSCPFDIKEAADGDPVTEGTVLIAPGAKNLIFQRYEGGVVARVVNPSPDDKYLPSVDVMFTSCADIFGSNLLGVVLTGMGNDGSKGVRAIKRAGGQVVAESEESAVVFGMPREAIATGVVDKVVPLDKVAREIMQRCGVDNGTSANLAVG